jgi:hypothetical protein
MDVFREIQSAIEISVKKYCESLGYDYTFQGAVTNIDNGKCTVSINGEETSCKILNGAMFSVGDIVLVNVSKNNYSNKVVIGKYGDVFDEGATIVTWDNVTNKPILATVSTTGSYNDLLNKPFIPTDTASLSKSDVYTKTEVNNLISTYTYSQITSSATWIITHNLNKRPSITVVDSAGTVVVGEIEYISNNEVKLTFKGGFSGTAYLN